MAQHDHVIDNAAGATVRADLNLALAAIVSNNSGATAPAPSFAHMWWADTTTNILKRRNAANSTWMELLHLDETNGLLRLDFDKGADIASAATTDIGGATGNSVTITGTVTITALGTITAGAWRLVTFAGALTLTHNGTSLILPGGADISTAAGDMMLAESLGSGNWRVLFFPATGAAVKGLVQVVNTQTGAVNTGTTTIPLDDTIPQNTEGDEYMTRVITPTKAANILEIEVVFVGTHSVNSHLGVALFQDTTAAALASGAEGVNTGNTMKVVSFKYRMVAGTVSATTFKVRAGGSSAGTTTFNGRASGRIHGGTMSSSITVTEIAA